MREINLVSGETELMKACTCGDVERAKELIGAGENVNAATVIGYDETRKYLVWR